MNKKIYHMHKDEVEGKPVSASIGDKSQREHLDFLCDCGEPVTIFNFAGLDCNGIRLRARCPICGQRYDFKLKVNFHPDPAQRGNSDSSRYKTINRLRIKEF